MSNEVEPSIIRLLEEYEQIKAHYMPAAQMQVMTVIAGANTTTTHTSDTQEACRR